TGRPRVRRAAGRALFQLPQDLDLRRLQRNPEKYYFANDFGTLIMDFSYIEEQQLLADSVNRLIEKEYDFEKRKIRAAKPEGFSREMWITFADMGLLGLSVPAEYGGFGAT